MAEDFDYGAAPSDAGGKTFKDPAFGPHAARIRSIIHLGMFIENFQGKPKAPAPLCSIIFELKEDDDFEEDGETPLELHKLFSLRKGDKAFLTKLTSALNPKGDKKGFDDFIGLPCQVEVSKGKEKKAGSGEFYANFGGVSAMVPKLAAITDELCITGAGHVRFEDLTKEAIMELSPITEVADSLCKGMNYQGSVAQGIIDAIREDNPEFAVRKKAACTEPQGTNPNDAPPPTEPPPESTLDDSQEF